MLVLDLATVTKTLADKNPCRQKPLQTKTLADSHVSTECKGAFDKVTCESEEPIDRTLASPCEQS